MEDTLNKALFPIDFEVRKIGGKNMRLNPVRITYKKQNQTFNQLKKFDKSSSEYESESFSDIDINDSGIDINIDHGKDKKYEEDKKQSELKEIENQKKEKELEKEKLKLNKINSKVNKALKLKNNIIKFLEVVPEQLNSKYAIVLPFTSEQFSNRLKQLVSSLKEDYLEGCSDLLFIKNQFYITIYDLNLQNLDFVPKLKEFFEKWKEENPKNKNFIEFEAVEFVEYTENYCRKIVIKPKRKNVLIENIKDYINEIINFLIDQKIVTKDQISKSRNFTFDIVAQRNEIQNLNAIVFDSDINSNKKIVEKVLKDILEKLNLINNNNEDEENLNSMENTFEFIETGFNKQKLHKKFSHFGSFGLINFNKIGVLDLETKEIIEIIN